MRSGTAVGAVAVCAALVCAAAARSDSPLGACTPELRELVEGTHPVRVLLAAGVERVKVTSSGPLSGPGVTPPDAVPPGCQSVTMDLSGAAAAPLRLAADGRTPVPLCDDRVRIAPTDDRTVNVRAAGSGGRVVVNGSYRGSVEVAAGVRGLTVVSLVPVDEYLPSVLGAEIGEDSPRAALEAQAVAARSYVLYHALRAAEEPYDLAATTAGQVYRGTSSESDATVRAAEETRGELLTAGGAVVDAVYHAVSGGVTADPRSVWGAPIAGLAAVYDGVGSGRDLSTDEEVRRFLLSPPQGVLGSSHPFFRWRTRLSADALTRTLAESLPRLRPEGGAKIGRLQDIRIDARAVSGHVTQVTFVGTVGAATLRGDAIRWAFGDGRAGRDGLRSTLFAVDKAGSRAPYSAYEFVGGGWGHGTGMSQAGAIELAQQGFDHRAILQHYYRLAELTNFVGPEPP